MLNHLPNNLRHLLAKHKMSSTELAERLGVTPQAASKWMQASTEKPANISIQHLLGISEIFNVSVDNLLKSDLSKPQSESPPAPISDTIESAFQALRALRADLKKKGARKNRLSDIIRNYSDHVGVFAG